MEFKLKLGLMIRMIQLWMIW